MPLKTGTQGASAEAIEAAAFSLGEKPTQRLPELGEVSMKPMLAFFSLFIFALDVNAQAGGYIYADGKSWVRGMEMNPNQTWTAISGDAAKALFDFLNTEKNGNPQIEGKALTCEKLATGYWCHMYVNRDGSIQKNSTP